MHRFWCAGRVLRSVCLQSYSVGKEKRKPGKHARVRCTRWHDAATAKATALHRHYYGSGGGGRSSRSGGGGFRGTSRRRIPRGPRAASKRDTKGGRLLLQPVKAPARQQRR
ncbi:unnamed protein product, partial [Ectocarpus sp. 12 AP-2014]